MWWRRQKTEVAEFLYNLLVAESPRGFARRVADRMGVPYPTLSKYWLGKRRFPAVLVKSLFLATDHDPRVAEFFVLEGSPFALVRRSTAPTESIELKGGALELAALTGRIAARIAATGDAEALADHDASEVDAALRALIQRASVMRDALIARTSEA